MAHEMGHHRLHLSEQGKTMIRDDDFNDRDKMRLRLIICRLFVEPLEKASKFIRLELKIRV